MSDLDPYAAPRIVFWEHSGRTGVIHGCSKCGFGVAEANATIQLMKDSGQRVLMEECGMTIFKGEPDPED